MAKCEECSDADQPADSLCDRCGCSMHKKCRQAFRYVDDVQNETTNFVCSKCLSGLRASKRSSPPLGPTQERPPIVQKKTGTKSLGRPKNLSKKMTDQPTPRHKSRSGGTSVKSGGKSTNSEEGLSCKKLRVLIEQDKAELLVIKSRLKNCHATKSSMPLVTGPTPSRRDVEWDDHLSGVTHDLNQLARLRKLLEVDRVNDNAIRVARSSAFEQVRRYAHELQRYLDAEKGKVHRKSKKTPQTNTDRCEQLEGAVARLVNRIALNMTEMERKCGQSSKRSR